MGWGALKGVFDPANKQWAKEHAELRGLLNDREWEAAERSTLNAHYTSPVVVTGIYDALARLGATRGRMLEPSVGSGNFLGLMPKGMRAGMQVFGVELDPITSRIAAGLYPKAKIKNQGFEDFDVPGGFFDIAAGNPPFGNEPLVDMQGSPYSGWSIHNYFFSKTIDKLRPGGLMAMVVSHSFLDVPDSKARAWIAKRARLVGAVRLPRTAFKENAGTEVVTDIIVFERTSAGESDPAWLSIGEQRNTNPKTGDVATHKVNRYFLDNPQNVLGTPSAGGTMYKANEYTVEPTGDLAQQLAGWVKTLPEGIFQPIDRTEKMQADEVPDGVKVGSYFVAADGTVKVRAADEVGDRLALAWTAPNDKAAERVKGMVGLRDTLRTQMRLERSQEATAEQIEANRAQLNRLYDQFQKAYGFVNDPTNRRLFRDDTEASLVLALEFDYDRGVSAAIADREGIEASKPSAKKADIFQRRVLFPPQDNVRVGTARDAMLASLNFRGVLDLPYMAKLYGKSEAAIITELGDLVFTTPAGTVVTADEYLSGDVKTKLAEAEVAARTDDTMRRNVEAMRKIIPADKKPSEIHASMGAKFIDGAVLDEFVKRITGATVTSAYVPSLGQWMFAGGSNPDPVLNGSTWGTGRAPALSIIRDTIAGKSVVVTDTVRNADGSTTTTVNQKETESAREKQRAIREEWQTWLWSDPERAAKVAADFNEQMNRWVDRAYDGSHLTLPGKVPDEVVTLLPHQKNGVWRALQSRQILLDHVVGAGKTYQMVAIAMELRRMGIARKPFFAVPNHLTLQWASEFARLYPGANVLAATPDDFSKGNREKFFSKIVTGDWDAVIVGHSSLKKIALPPETEREVLEEQVREIASAIEDMKRQRGDSRIVADMQRIKANLEGKMKSKLAALGTRDKVVTFDELGVDAVFVDELHEFKNLTYNSTMDRNPGMGNPAGSDKAFDLFVKLQWMFNTFGKNAPIVGATGTPVSNSLVEMFNMQRFLQYPQLKAEGLHVFDAWARQFGSVESVYEVAPSGTGYRSSTRFSKFKNLGALMAHYNAFADVVTLDDLKAQEEARGKRFPVPKIRGGRPTIVVAERSPDVAKFMGVPELETADGRPLFGINFADGETVKFEEKDGRTLVSVSSPRAGEAPVVRMLGSYPTEGDARMAVVEAALSPRIAVDPKSILGQFQNLKQLNKESKGKINALSLTGAANKAGLDFRLVNPAAPDFPGSKINLAVDNMLTEYSRWSADKGAQLVFCDLSVPLSERNNLASKARRLYVRENGALAHKQGTMHTVEGLEALPFFVVASGAGASKSFAAYDAASGLSLRAGFKSKVEAVAAITEIAKDEAKRQLWLDGRIEAGEITQDQIDAYNDENEIDASESPSITLQDIAGLSAASAFSVYDDIKAKLVARGIPEAEIAFIHDYDTPTAKDKLFKAVKRGDVRFLLGSTPKMGAGTNVQDRLVALHHIDAPWRPSDLEQREGRIIRRNNKLYERDPDGFEVGIYRYATKQTYDTRRWQILEHKARGIEQLRNYDGTTNEIDDIDGEAANAADMKAAASGDPLILRETQLRNEVKRLENLQAAHSDAVTDYANKARWAREYHTASGPRDKAELERLAAVTAKHPVPEEGLPGGSTVDGRAFADRKEFTQAIARVVAEAASAGSPTEKRVTFRGLRFSVQGSGKGSVSLQEINRGAFGTSLGMWAPGEAISATGVVQRVANFADRIGAYIADIDARIAEERETEKRWTAESKKPFAQADELVDAREQHKKVQRLLIARGPEVPEAQKPMLQKAQEQQRRALRDEGFGEALDELTAFSSGSDDGEAKFSRRTMGDQDPALAMLEELDPLFKFPKLSGRTVSEIAFDLDPTIKVTSLPKDKNRERWRVTLPSGAYGDISIRRPNKWGPDVYGFDIDAQGNSANVVTDRPGDNADAVSATTEDVFIDVSQMKTGQGGDAIYAIAGALAHNTGRIFIGDPNGVSDVAMRRRAENMLSLALRYGTTDFLAPHPDQAKGNKSLGVPPLKWVYGDDAGNIERLVAVNVQSLQNALPLAQTWDFDVSTGQFVKNDERRDLAGILGAFSEARRKGDSPQSGDLQRASAAGRTFARAVVLRALSRQEGGGAEGRGPGRDGLLDRLGAAASGPARAGLTGLFSRRAGRGISMQDAEAVRATVRNALPNAPDIILLESVEQAPEDLREQIMVDGAQDDVEAVYWRGSIYAFPKHLESVDRALFVIGRHEVRHHGMRVMFKGNDTQMGAALLAMWRSNQALRAATAGIVKAGRARQNETVKAVEEALADMPVERIAALKGFDRLVAAVRSWLRQMATTLRRRGFGGLAAAIEPTAWTDNDVAAFVLKAEQVSGVGGGYAAYSRAGDAHVRYSRTAEAIDLWRSAGTAKAVATVFDDLTRTQQSFNWWHRTVGTQYHKAKTNPLYGQVYERAQEYLHDTAAFANDPADMAPGLLPQLKTLGDIRRRLTLKKDDANKLAEVIFRGNLELVRDDSGQLQPTGPDDTPGVVFNPDELRDFGLNDEQIGLYQQFRRATDRSLDILVGADVARMMGDGLPDSMRAMLSAGDVGRFKGIVTAFLKEQKQKAERELAAVRKTHRNEMSRFWRKQKAELEGPRGRAGARLALLEDLDAEKRAIKLRHGGELYRAEQEAKRWAESQQMVADKYERIDALKARGYAPLMRFGRFTVYVQGAEGEQRFFGMYESEAEANAAARMFREAAEEGETVTQGVLSEQAHKQFVGMSPETLELFAEVAGVEKTEAFQQYLRLAKNNRSALKRLIRRKGVAGFSEDVPRVLASFITSNGRAAAASLHLGKMAEAVEAIPKEQGDVKDEAIKLREYVQNPQEEAQAIRGTLFAMFLGGSVASAMVNMTQPLMMTLPYLAQFGGARVAAQRLGAAVKAAMPSAKHSTGLAQALRLAEKEGIVEPQELHQLQAEASRSLGNNPHLRRVLFAWGSFFSLAERFNRRVSFIAAYNTAVATGRADPFAFARESVDQTQGVYNKGNRPNWARGAVGATLFTFKQYSISYVEFLKRLPTRQRAMALGILILAAGLQGIPGADDLDDLIDTLGQHLGYDTNSKLWKTRALTEALGPDAANFVLQGFSALPGIPLDVSGRLGLGNFIPGTGLLRKDTTDKSGEVVEALGPAGSMVANTAKALPSLLQGDVARFNEIAGPVALKNLAKGVEMYLTGEYRDMQGRKVREVTAADAAIKAVGFQPAEVAQDSRKVRMAAQQVGLARNIEAEIANQWAQALADNKPEQVQKARQRLAEWNASNPESRIVITLPQIVRRVREIKASRDERFIKRAPKEMRASVEGIVQ